jgi:hypothetical protein
VPALKRAPKGKRGHSELHVRIVPDAVYTKQHALLYIGTPRPSPTSSVC